MLVASGSCEHMCFSADAKNELTSEDTGTRMKQLQRLGTCEIETKVALAHGLSSSISLEDDRDGSQAYLS